MTGDARPGTQPHGRRGAPGALRATRTGERNGRAPALAHRLAFGGLAVIQHAVLRLALWRRGDAPLHYARFLDYAAQRILLRKVGGGYLFLHRLLLEHFAGEG